MYILEKYTCVIVFQRDHVFMGEYFLVEVNVILSGCYRILCRRSTIYSLQLVLHSLRLFYRFYYTSILYDS